MDKSCVICRRSAVVIDKEGSSSISSLISMHSSPCASQGAGVYAHHASFVGLISVQRAAVDERCALLVHVDRTTSVRG